jgi:transposase
LLGISKRGESYRRKLLMHGARATRRWVGRKTDRRSPWMRQLVERRGHNRTVVAIANKNARIVWALRTSHQAYEPAKG